MYNRNEIRVISSAKKKQNPFAKDVVVDPKGQWANFGQVVKIPGNNITTHGMPGAILGIPDRGMPRIMNRDETHHFDGANNVTEIPLFQEAGEANLNKVVEEDLTDDERFKQTLDWFNTNPYADMPKMSKLKEVATTSYPSYRGVDKTQKLPKVFIPHAGVYAESLNPDEDLAKKQDFSYQPANVGDDYRGLNIVIVNGKPMVVPPDDIKSPERKLYDKFNQEYLHTYKKPSLGLDEIFHVYGKGLPYHEELQEQYRNMYPELFTEPLALNKCGGPVKMREGGYIEMELDDNQIEAYRAGGFVVDDIEHPMEEIVATTERVPSSDEKAQALIGIHGAMEKDKLNQLNYATPGEGQGYWFNQNQPLTPLDPALYGFAEAGVNPKISPLAMGHKRRKYARENPTYKFQEGGLKPRISYTPEQIEEYKKSYTGDEPFMDRFLRESDEMGYFTVTDEQGNIRSYDPAAIHGEIMQHGSRAKKLAELTGGTEEEIKKYFQPSFDYHQASYDVRGRKMLDELIDKGMSKEEAFDELINKKKFGTKEGLERVFSQSYDDLVQYKDYQKEKAQYDKLNAAQQRAEQYSHLTDEQLLAESKKQSGPTVEGANYLAELDRRKFIANQPKQEPLRTPAAPVVSDNTRVDTQARDLKIADTQNRMDYNRRGFSLDSYSPEQEQAAYQKYVQQMQAYNDIGIDIKDFVTPDGEYNYEALAHAMNNPDNASALHKNFQQQEQARYDAAPWYQRYASNVSAFLDDPINVGGNLLSGEGPMLNQSKMRNDPEYMQQVAQRYGLDPATVKAQWDSGMIDDVFDYVNPGHWGTAAGKNITDASKEFDKGNYWEGMKDYGTAFLNVAPAVPAARIMRGAKPLPDAVTKIPQYAEQVMSANPSKYLGSWAKPINLNTALAGSSATYLPGAVGKVWDDPTDAGAWGELGLTTLGVLPGAGALKHVSPYVKSAPRGLKSVITRQAPVSDLFKRSDLARFSTTEKLADMQRRLAAGEVLDPSDYAWYTSLQHSEDALKYADPSASLRMNIHPMSSAAAQDFKLMNQAKKIKKMNKGLSEAEIKAEDALFKSYQDKLKEGAKLTTSEQKKYDALFPKKQIEDAISKSIPSKAEMMSDPNFLEFYKSQPLNTRINMNEMFASPQDYWQHQIYMNNPQLESVMRSKNIFSPQEYIVGRAPASKFKPVEFSSEGVSPINSGFNMFGPAVGAGAYGFQSLSGQPIEERYKFLDGGGKEGMMKAKIAYESQFGNNPAIQRMLSGVDEPYIFGNGQPGTHFMSSVDNYAVPQIQERDGALVLGDFSSDSNEAIRFNTSEEADYFAKNYKKVAPAFNQDGGTVMELDDAEIADLKRQGFYIEEEG
jgi:hypothetical protein